MVISIHPRKQAIHSSFETFSTSWMLYGRVACILGAKVRSRGTCNKTIY
jgi:hypothetical protein